MAQKSIQSKSNIDHELVRLYVGMLNSQIGYGKTQTSEKKKNENLIVQVQTHYIFALISKKKKKLDDTKAWQVKPRTIKIITRRFNIIWQSKEFFKVET